VAFVCLLTIRWLLGRSEYLLLRWNVAKISALAAMIVVVCYMGIAGLGISVIRATIMVLTFMLAILFNRHRDLYQAVALAAFLILIISPSSLFDISFQLSFSAVLTIVFLTPRLVALLPAAIPSPPPEGIREALGGFLKKSFRGAVILTFVSLSATLGTLPLILFYFNRLSIVSPIANLAVVPILGLVATPLFLLTILSIPLSSILTDLILRLSVWLVRFSLWLIDRLAALPFSAPFVTTPNLLEMVAYYLLLISLGFCLDRWCLKDRSATKGRMRFWNGTALLLILFFFFNTFLFQLRSFNATNLSLTALDVGQGSAILVRFPGGEKMLVDGGGFYDDSFDIGRSVLAPYLWQEGIDRIETVVLTHPHPDHLQGLLFILEHFRVREVWSNGDESDSPLYQRFLQIIRRRGLTVQTCNDATPARETAGVRVEFLNPRAPLDRENSGAISLLRTAAARPYPSQGRDHKTVAEDTNDHSLVLKLRYRDRSFLLPADITSLTEIRLLQTGTDLKSDVLFVPHHGSVHSSTDSFIRSVSPLIGVVSCGWDNIHRFPHPDVEERYLRAGARLLRTDRDGAVTLETDGKELNVSTFVTQRR
jgi:competence protein ComEC